LESFHTRSNDLERALTARIQEESNLAFENHWLDCDAADHRVLSALAWATTHRPQLDIQGIEAAMGETRLTLPRRLTFAILERLAEEEILMRDGPTYSLWVPLFRRWIAWRWPPERVREEPVETPAELAMERTRPR
jgi:hypothetical protein